MSPNEGFKSRHSTRSVQQALQLLVSDSRQYANETNEIGILIQYAFKNHQHHEVIRLFETYSSKHTQHGFLTGSGGADIWITMPILNCYLEALLYLGRISEVVEIITHIELSPIRQPTPQTYAILLKAYVQSLNLYKARLLVHQMIDSGVRINRRIVRIILRGESDWAISLKSIDSLLDLLFSRDIRSRDKGCYNLIMDAYLRRDRPDKAKAVLDLMKARGLKSNAETFYVLMKYQARQEGPRGVQIMLNSMTKFGILPDRRHLNLLLSNLARNQPMDLKAAEALFRPYSIMPDTATCNIILRMLLRRKFTLEDLQNHFKRMKELSIPPDVYTFTILLNEFKHKSRRWQPLRTLVQCQCALDPTKVNQITYNVILHHMFSRSSHSAHSSETGPVPESSPPLQWDLRTLTKLVIAYARSREWSRIVGLHLQLHKRGVKLDRGFYRSLIKALLDGKKYRESEKIVSRLYASDDILDRLFGRECEIRISRAYFRDYGRGKKYVLRSIDRFLKYADNKRVMISEKHCNLIAIALLDIRLERFAISLLESRYHMQGRFQDLADGGELGMSAWTTLMRAYARKGKYGIQDLKACIERALSNPSQPPTRTFLNFLHFLGHNPKLRSSDPENCDFFLRTRLECLQNRPRCDQTPKGRSSLTVTGILQWVNNLDGTVLKERLPDLL